MVQDCAIYACSAASMRHMPNTDWQAQATSLTLYDGRKSSAMASFIMERSNVSGKLFTDSAAPVALTLQWAQALSPDCASHQLVLVMCRF